MDFSYDQMFREYAKAQGFTKDDFKIDKKKAVELMKQYHEGDQKDAIFKMYIGLKYYITRCIYKYGSTYLQTRPGDIDAMETSCFFAVQDAMRNYDPERTSPTTYFDFYIRSAIQRFMENELSRTTSARTEDIRYDLTHVIHPVSVPFSCCFPVSVSFSSQLKHGSTVVCMALLGNLIQDPSGAFFYQFLYDSILHVC